MTGLIEDKEQVGIKMLFFKNSVHNFIVKSRYRYKNHKTDILDLKLYKKF